MIEGIDRRDPELLRLAWAQLQQDWDRLEALCATVAKASRGRVTFGECLSEVADRMPGMLATWDPRKGASLKTHVMNCARWYLFKTFVYNAAKRSKREGERLKPSQHPTVRDLPPESEDQEEVKNIVAQLHPYHAAMLHLRFSCGLGYSEIGWVIGLSKSMAFSRVADALDAARELAGTEGTDRS